MEMPQVAKGKMLRVNFDIRSIFQDPGSISVVLKRRGSGKTYVIPATLRLKSQSEEGSDFIILPQGLPHGTYRIYLQCSEGARVVSKGHYFEAGL
jgi:hypothetical protein